MIEKIGAKIKQLCDAKEISPEKLAEMSELDAEDIKLIEEGEVTPSMSVLLRITRALGIRLGTILDGEESSSPVITRKGAEKSTMNVMKGQTSHHKNHEFFALAQDKADRHMEPFIIEIEYLSNNPDIYSHHEGEEFIYVLDGEAEIHYGVSVYKLSEGDSIYFDSLVPHYFSSAQPGTTSKILAITYTPL